MKPFLTQEEENSIVQAISLAEKQTSGEIRVHIEQNTCQNEQERSQTVFFLLNMHKTQHRNGVLLYINTHTKHFSLLGDEGIHKNVSSDFWEITKNEVIAHFKQGFFCQGIIAGIEKVGQQLQLFFPYLPNDINEIPNEISKSNSL